MTIELAAEVLVLNTITRAKTAITENHFKFFIILYFLIDVKALSVFIVGDMTGKALKGLIKVNFLKKYYEYYL